VTLQFLAETIKELRESKLPDWEEIGTAGSYFKNPVVQKEQFEHLKNIRPEIV
jgi:UDP-N-acetylmuramate dehydrogenase